MSTETVRETFYRCEVCGQRFKVLSEASAHEAVCREREFRARSLIGRWVYYGTRVGFAFDAADNGSCVRLYVPLEALIHIAPADQCRVTDEETHGVMPSIPASKTNLREALAKGTDRFMVETDYIDDPEKPGAIMSVTTVPKKVKAWLANGQVPVESIHRICGDIPDSLYKR